MTAESESETPQIYISQRTTTEGAPHDCPNCGRRYDEINPPRLVSKQHPTATTAGSMVVECPGCGTVTRNNNESDTEQQKTSTDVGDMLREDKRKGKKGGGSSSGPSRKKPRKRTMAVRWEQDIPAFGNGRRSGSIVQINTERIERTRRVHLRISIETVADLRSAGTKEPMLDGTPTPMTSFMRQALIAHLSKLRNPRSMPGPKTSIYARLYESEIESLKEASETWELPMGDLLENCLERLL